MRPQKFLATILIMGFLLAHPALANRKTDIITLYNGDRVTGEIKSLLGSILELKTNSMGTIQIEWPEISNVQSDYYYEVRLSDGQRLFGSFNKKSRPGQVLLVDASGGRELEWLQVVEIRPVEDTLAKRIKVYLSAGYSYSKASSVTQLSLNTELSYEDERSQNTLVGRNEVTRTTSNDSASSRWDLSRYTWSKNRSNRFRTVFGNYENNQELDLSHRIGAGAGLGRYFIDTNRMRFLGAMGLQVITEQPKSGKSNQDVELYLHSNFATWKFSTPELDVDLNFSLYPSLTDSGRVRSDTSLRIRWELLKDLYWDVSAWATSDNRAADENRNIDYSITTGLGWKY